MATTPKLGVRLMATNDISKEVVFNEAAIVFDTMVSRTATARQNNPPASPQPGDCYIVSTAPTGVWLGRENQIALFFNGWRFYAPTQKMKFFLQSTSTFWTYSGTSWTQDAAGTPSTLDDLTNVGGSAPEDGQVLGYDMDSGLWVPVTLPSQSPLGDLPDVHFIDLQQGQMLAWDDENSRWRNVHPPAGGGGAGKLSELEDVEMPGTPTNGQLLTWDSGKARFVTYAFPAAELKDLTDVVTTGVQANDVLAWNGATWAPSPAVITYSFLGMVDGPQTFDGYANHFLVVDPTESKMEFRSLQTLIDNLDDFAMADLTDLQAAADVHVGKVITLAKTGADFHYTYTALPNWSVVFRDGEDEITARIRSLTFNGFEVDETAEGHVVVTAQNALQFQAEGDPVADPVSAINFTGNAVNITLIEGVLTVDFEIPPPAVNLGNLADVDLATVTPLDGHVLRFDGVAQKWVPGEGGFGGGIVDGEVEPALYEYGPFAPPTPGMFPLRHNAPSADLTAIKNRGLFVQPGPQSTGVRHGVVARSIGEQDVPWVLTARIIPSSFQVSGHAAGIVLQRAFNNSFVFLAIGNSSSDTQFSLRLGWVSAAGSETILLTEPNFYPWLRLAFDGDFIRAYVSAEGLIWHPFGNPIDPGTTLQGTPDRVGITNRSNATHTGAVGALVTYWDDPEFPAAARVQQGVVALGVGGLQDVDIATQPPADGQTLVWSEVEEKWVPGDASGGTADYPDFEGNAGKLLTVNDEEDGVEWKDAPISLPPGGDDGEVLTIVDGQPEWSDPGSVPSAFTDLTDAPDGYLGYEGKVVAVKEDGSGLEFVDGGSGGAIFPDYGEHLWWRLLIHEVDGGSRVGIQEIEFRNTRQGSVLTVGGTAHASSASQPPDGAFDGEISGAWFSDAAEPVDGQWVGYEFVDPVSVRFLTVMGSQAYPDESPTAFEVQYSDDGVEWETAWEVVDPGNWNTGQNRYYHAPIDLSFTDLNDAPPTLVGQAGKQLVVRDDEAGFDLVLPEEPEKELPEFSGSDAGKMLRVSLTGTELQWTDAAGGGSGGAVINNLISSMLIGRQPSSGGSTSAYATKGNIFDVTQDMHLFGVRILIETTGAETYKLAVYELTPDTLIVERALIETAEVTYPAGSMLRIMSFLEPLTLLEGMRIAVVVIRTDAGPTGAVRVPFPSSSNYGIEYSPLVFVSNVRHEALDFNPDDELVSSGVSGGVDMEFITRFAYEPINISGRPPIVPVGPRRTWRIVALETQDPASNVLINRVAFRAGGADHDHSDVSVIFSNQNNPNTNSAAQAFLDNTNVWSSGSPGWHWIGAEFRNSVVVDQVRLRAGDTTARANGMPIKFAVEFTDGFQWSRVGTFETGPWAPNDNRTFDLEAFVQTNGSDFDFSAVRRGFLIGARRYWRVRRLNSSHASWFGLAELKFNGSTPSGGAPFASSNNTSNPPALAFDGNPATLWTTAAGTLNGAHIGYAFDSPVAVRSVSIQAGDTTTRAEYAPTAFVVEFSDDGAVWVPVIEHTSTGWVSGETRVFEVPSLYLDLTMDVPAGGGVEEAPQDGKQYVRKDAEWSEFDFQEGFEDAPEDGKQYARRDGDWAEIATLPEAPDNGLTYGRKSGLWVPVEGVGGGEAGFAMPYGGARISPNAQRTYTNTGAADRLRFDVSDKDTDNFWSAENPHGFTIPAGVTKVRLACAVKTESGGAAQPNNAFAFQKNGTYNFPGNSGIALDFGGYANPGGSFVSDVLDVEEGDFFDVYFAYSGNVIVNATRGQTWFSIEVVEREFAAAGLNARLSDLLDVDALSPEDGETPVWDEGEQKWVAGRPTVQANVAQGLNKPFKGALARFNADKAFGSRPVFPVLWDATDYDTDDFWSEASPGRFTIPAGVSMIRLHATLHAASGVYPNTTNVLLQFGKNGSTLFRGNGIFSAASAYSDGGISITSPPIPVEEGDYFELRFNDAKSGSVTFREVTSLFAIEVLETVEVV